jgi:hypothetical protein
MIDLLLLVLNKLGELGLLWDGRGGNPWELLRSLLSQTNKQQS